MAKWKYQSPTASAENLQATLDEMAAQGWEVITVLVQRSVTAGPTDQGPIYNAEANKAKMTVTEYRIVARQQAGE
jgi:hypothetical protein